MIPLRSTERVVNPATVTVTLLVLNIAAFLYQLALTPGAYGELLMNYGIVPDKLHPISLLTSMFLHGGWLHLIGNLWFLWVFGRNVEDILGGPRFLTFYLLCGLAAGGTHILLNSYSRMPTIGASGAIAGVMGAYLVKFPGARIVTLVPIFIFITTLDIPAAFLLIYWFAIQIFSGVGSVAQAYSPGGGTAWFAHVGGFLAGMLLIRRFRTRRRFGYYNWE